MKDEGKGRRPHFVRNLPDLLVLVAAALVTAGCALAWLPLGLVVGGLAVGGVALAIEHRRAVARARKLYRRQNGRDPDPT